MKLNKKNKENIPESKPTSKEKKKLSKQSKPQRSSSLLKQSLHLKSEKLSYLNYPFDESSLTIKSARKKVDKKPKTRTRSMNSSQCDLKIEQKTKKVIPITFDDSYLKKSKIQKTSKSKNPRKQSQYVSYLVQAQRRVMNSLAGIDTSQLKNCHQITNLQSQSNTQLLKLRHQMQGLKQRFQRLESEQIINDKETIQSHQEISEKNTQTIEHIHDTKKYYDQLQKKSSIEHNYNIDRIQIQQRVEKQVTQKYGNIITQYEKMLNFYKERLQSYERDLQTQKQRQKIALEQMQSLKMTVEMKKNENQLKRNDFSAEKKQLKQEITILQKSLNKKNKQLMVKSEQLTQKQTIIKSKDRVISELEQKLNEKNNTYQNQTRINQKIWKEKIDQLRERNEEIEKSFVQKINELIEEKLGILRQIDEKNNIIQKLQKDHLMKDDEILQLSQSNAQTMAEFGTQRMRLQSIIAEMRQELQQREDSFKTTIKELNDQKVHGAENILIIQRLKQQLTERQRQIYVLKEKCRQMNMLQQQLQDKESHIENLQEESKKIASLEQQLVMKDKRVQQLQQNSIAEVNRLKQELNQNQLSISQLLMKLQEAQQQNNLLETYKQSQLKCFTQDYQKRIAQKEAELHNVKAILSNFTEEVRAIKDELKANQQFITLKQQQNQAINKLLISERESFSSQLSEERKLLNKQRQLYSHQKSLLVGENQQLKQSNQFKEMRIEELSLLVRQSEEKVQSLKTDMFQKQSQWKVQIQKMKIENSTISQQVTQLTQERHKLSQINDQLSTENLLLSKKVQEMILSIAEKNSSLYELSAKYQKETSQKDNQINELSKLYEEKQTLNHRCEQTIQLQSQQLLQLKNQITELTAYNQRKISSLKQKHQERLQNWRSEIDSFKSQLKQKQQQIQTLQQQNQQLHLTIEVNTKHITTQTQNIHDQQSKIRRLQNNLSQSNKTINGLKDHNFQLSTKLEQMAKKLSSITVKYEQEKIEHENSILLKNNEIQKACQKLLQTQKQVENVTKKNAQLCAQIDKNKKVIKQKQIESQKHLKQLQIIPVLKSQCQQLKLKLIQSLNLQKAKSNEVQKLQENNKKFQSEIILMTENIKDLKSRHAGLQSKIKEKQAEINQKNTSIEKLTSQLTQSKQKQNSLTQKISTLKDENQAIISTYNHQLQQRKQIIEDLMKEKRQLYQKLHGSIA